LFIILYGCSIILCLLQFTMDHDPWYYQLIIVWLNFHKSLIRNHCRRLIYISNACRNITIDKSLQLYLFTEKVYEIMIYDIIQFIILILLLYEFLLLHVVFKTSVCVGRFTKLINPLYFSFNNAFIQVLFFKIFKYTLKD